MSPRTATVLALLALVGCGGPPITAANVSKIQTCTTTFPEVTEMFGKPSHQSRMGDLYIHEFRSGRQYATHESAHRLMVVYNNHDVVVDVLFDVPDFTLASVGDHCKGGPSEAPAPPAPSQ